MDDALRVRWAVFGGELELIPGRAPPTRREVNGFDTLRTTTHLVVYVEQEPVATVRILLPNAEVASVTGGVLGVEMEQRLDLSGLGGPGRVVAEASRFCVRRPWRHSEAVVLLQAAFYAESRRRGVTDWLAAANLETDSEEDARLIQKAFAHHGWLSPRWRMRTPGASVTPVVSNMPFYSAEEKARAREGRWETLRLPRSPVLVARRMGARFISEPLYDAGFRRFTLPLIAALDDIPTRTLARFAALMPEGSTYHSGGRDISP
ncbi:GNAT family N-acetyltransferase [Myxococcus sp. SDU36]|uniref:GNAT family N-acetyltransferase n=1 Tax=Myxococcus sp. SDU36 TaxID=2831967 RepID=UPI002542933B|nr:GNAT family N-acetyltransferase [Myxococcus sp. SDU36]